MFTPGKVTALVGGQFGSEAKGLIASYLAVNFPTDKHVATTNAGAQAGHTTILKHGTKFVAYHLPTIGILQPKSIIYLNAGSIIDVALLDREIKDISEILGYENNEIANRVRVDPNAAVITDDNKLEEASEKGTKHLASTGKGVGSALTKKVMRQPSATYGSSDSDVPYTSCNKMFMPYLLEAGYSVSVEVPQGTGLGINNPGFYPTCTSRDCHVIQGLSDAGIHPHYLKDTVMVCRTFPIRVGNTYDQQGAEIGNSGVFYSDSHELSWSDFPGVAPEITTVTKRIRRIATFSLEQYRHALHINRPTVVALTFINYLRTEQELLDLVMDMRDVEDQVGLTNVTHWYSWGPRVDQVTISLDEACSKMKGE